MRRTSLRQSAVLAVAIVAAVAWWAKVSHGPDDAAAQSGAWQQTAGPLGGTVTRLLTINGTPFAALYSGGIYRLHGREWIQTAINRGIPENRIFDIVANPRDPRIIYAAQMIGCGAKSTDGGASWSGLCDPILTATKGENFSSFTLALDPNDPSTIYLPGHGFDQKSLLLVSRDGGEHWSVLYDFGAHYDFNHLVFYNGRMYLSTREDGIMVSDDQGRTWRGFSNGLKSKQTNHFLVFHGRLYLEGETLWQYNFRQGGSLFRLNTSAIGWERISGPTRVTGTATDGKVLWVGNEDGKLWSSVDGRRFILSKTKGLPNFMVGEMLASERTLYVGVGSNGIFRSTDGGKTFGEFNNALASVATREVLVDPNNAEHLYVGTWDRLGLFVSWDAGAHYMRAGQEYNLLAIGVDPQNFDHLYAGGDASFVEGQLNQNKKITWQERTKPGPQESVVKFIAVHPKDPKTVFVGIAKAAKEGPDGYGLWYTRDNGNTWKRSRGIDDHAVHAIIVDPADPAIVFAAALGSGVYKSVDAGATFTKIGGDELRYTYRLAMDPKNPNHLVAGSNLFFAGLEAADQISGKFGGLYETQDGGQTWVDLVANIRDYDGTNDPDGFQGWLYNFGHLVNYEQILIDPNNPARIIVGHHGESVVITNDGGKTWEKQTRGMIPGQMHNYAYCLGQSREGSRLYACTCGRGLFRGDVSSKSGTVSWRPSGIDASVVYAQEETNRPRHKPLNAKQAREFLLSTDEYFHSH